MKRIGFSLIAFLMLYSPAHALTYNYELQGRINYSDFYNMNGYDPFIDVGNTTFRLYGTFGDLGTKAYTSIDNQTYVKNGPTDLFAPASVPDAGFDVLNYHENIPCPLGVWQIAGYDTTQKLIADDGSVNWEMFSNLDWQILWIGANPNDPNLPEYWEYDGTITSASITASPVPEPATILLLGAGIAGICGSRLRRRRK